MSRRVSDEFVVKKLDESETSTEGRRAWHARARSVVACDRCGDL